MRPKIKTARRKASKLHGATAGYVSIVDRGANETPFTLIKSKNGASAMSIKTRGKSKAAKSHKAIPSALKQEETKAYRTETLMAKMIFSADVFEDEADVRSWIEEAEWEAEQIDITKNADGDWEARPNGLKDEDFDRLGAVEVEDEGVSGFVGERKIFEGFDDQEDEEEDEDDDEDEADEDAGTETKSEEEATTDEDKADKETAMSDKKKPSKKAEFLAKRKTATEVKKFDAWDAMFSESNSIASVIKDATNYDGTPPGFAEVNLAFNVALGNILKSDGMPQADRTAAMQKAASDFVEVVDGLDQFFTKFIEMDEDEVEKAVKSADDRAKLAKWAEVFADWLNNNDPEKGEEASDDKEKEAKAVEPAPATIDYSKISATVAELVAKAVEPLVKEVETVSGTVEALASRRPSKKAIASDDTGTAAPARSKEAKTVDDDEFLRTKQVKGIFG